LRHGSPQLAVPMLYKRQPLPKAYAVGYASSPTNIPLKEYSEFGMFGFDELGAVMIDRMGQTWL